VGCWVRPFWATSPTRPGWCLSAGLLGRPATRTGGGRPDPGYRGLADTAGRFLHTTWPGDLPAGGLGTRPCGRGRLLTGGTSWPGAPEKEAAQLGKSHRSLRRGHGRRRRRARLLFAGGRGLPFGGQAGHLGTGRPTPLSPRLVHVLKGGGVGAPENWLGALLAPAGVAVGGLWRGWHGRRAGRGPGKLAWGWGKLADVTWPWGMAEAGG